MKQIAIILIFLSVLSCKKNKTPQPIIAPAQAVLVLPASNETCTQGRVISAGQSAVTLKWNVSANTDNYDITIKNLLNGELITKSASTNELEVTISRNTPYSWYVVSKSSATTETAKSETWKFYNAGEASVSYAPFPAENLKPTMRQAVTAVNSKVNLSWDAQDVDNDLSGYDVYLGTSSSSLPLLQANITAKKLDDVTVTANTTYYWKVVAKDSKQHSSVSDVHIFKVN